MNPLISVIIPVYNVNDYLERCVDSVIKQTYQNLEIILVDDGSTDGSERKCDELANIDSRIKVLHKANGGAASARNAGIKVAKGSLIGFVDSDDYIKADMYEVMQSYMEDYVDIVSCGTAVLNEKKGIRRSDAYCNPRKVMCFSTKEAIKEMLLLRNLCFSPCDKLFRKELFPDHCFPDGRYCEDLPAMYAVAKKSRKIVNIGDVKYLYCYRPDSVSRKAFSVRRVDYVLFARDILFDVKENFPELSLEAEAMYIRNLYIIIGEIDKAYQSERYDKIRKRLCRALRHMFIRAVLNKNIEQQELENIIKALY